MKDICIRLNYSSKPWSPIFKERLDTYLVWFKDNIPEGQYYMPNASQAYIYFLEEDDLMAFTMRFGHVYKRGKPSGLTTLDKMLLHETALEKYREKNNN